MEAVAAGKIVMRMMNREDGPVALAAINGLKMPALVILLGAEGSGPVDWPGLDDALVWAASTFPGAYQLPRSAYEALVEEVVLHRRFLWVETSPELLPAWTRALGGRPVRLATA